MRVTNGGCSGCEVIADLLAYLVRALTVIRAVPGLASPE